MGSCGDLRKLNGGEVSLTPTISLPRALMSSSLSAAAGVANATITMASAPLDPPRHLPTLTPPCAHSPLRLLEILQVRRRLVLLRRHQVAVGADVVDLLADADMRIVLGADRLAPPDSLPARGATIVLGDGPGPRQGVVDGGDLVVQQVHIALVEIDALLDHGLVVLVHRNAGAVEGAWPLQATGLDREQI